MKSEDEPVFDTQEQAIERAKMIVKWGNDPTTKIMIQRNGMPLWICHLVQCTIFEWVGYKELKD